MAVSGKRLVCRSRLKRSSSTNATMRPSRSRHADVSWLKQLMPRMLCTTHPSASDNPRTSPTRRVLPLRRPVRPVSGTPLVEHQTGRAAYRTNGPPECRGACGRLPHGREGAPRAPRRSRVPGRSGRRGSRRSVRRDLGRLVEQRVQLLLGRAERGPGLALGRALPPPGDRVDRLHRVRPLDLGSVVTLGPASRGKVTIQRSPPTRSGHEESQNHDGRPPYSAGKVVVGVVGGSVAGGAVVGGAVAGGAVVGGEVVRVVLGGLVVPVTRWVVVVARPLVVLVDPLSGNPWAGPNTPGPLVVVGRV